MCKDLMQSIIWGRPAPEVLRAIEALRGVDLAALPAGRHVIEGDRIFANVDEYTTRPASACRLEAHRRYHDIQIMIEGRERIGVTSVEGLRVIEPYDEGRDVGFFEGTYKTITLEAGQAAVFAPRDAHAPQMRVERPERVRKVVVKVAVEGEGFIDE